MWLLDGEGYRTAALHGDLPEAFVKQWRSGTLHTPDSCPFSMVRAIQSRKTVHVSDMRKEEGLPRGRSAGQRAPLILAGVRTVGHRADAQGRRGESASSQSTARKCVTFRTSRLNW